MQARTVGLFLVFAGVVFGQQPRTYGSPTGFGNILFPGMGTPPPIGSVTDTGHAGRLGRTVSGYPGYNGGGGYRGGRQNTVVVPYGVPVYVGGGGGYYDAPPPQQAPVVQQAPPVIINQYFTPEVVRPVMREYSDLPEPAPTAPNRDETPNVKVYPPQARVTPPAAPARAPEEAKANITLIALKDSSVLAAIGYWAENGDLIYITKTYARKSVPLDRIDKELSEQLNRERGMEFLISEK